MLYDRWIRTALSQLEGKPPHEWHIWSGNISMRREVWRQVGGYDDAMREYGCEDTDLGFRVAALGVKFVYEPRALSYHIHVCGYRAMRRQAYEGGRSFVRLARKYELPLTEFPGIATEGRVQRAVRESWRVAPALTEQVGRGLTGALWAADVSQWRGVQMLAARAVHRFYKIRGVLDEVKRRAPVTPAADRKLVTRPSHGGG
jgi:GT2 family glycosyltransferase